ncbi:MAG: HRDC domain-containing protein, partial [Tepidiphilus sp.]|nr:HRDC domain-containing protein [Tepidiphilus sp.]
KTLRELARRAPATLAELAGIEGIGARKRERWGKELLALLAAASDESAALAVLDKAADQPPLPSDL